MCGIKKTEKQTASSKAYRLLIQMQVGEQASITDGFMDKEAVDRYIRDYESLKVVRKATADIDKISQITRLP